MRASGWTKRCTVKSSASELVIGVPEAATSARRGFCGVDVARLDVKVPGPLRAIRINSLERRLVRSEAQFAELWISSTISWSTPISAIVSMSSLRDFSRSRSSSSPSFIRSMRLRESRSAPSTRSRRSE